MERMVRSAERVALPVRTIPTPPLPTPDLTYTLPLPLALRQRRPPNAHQASRRSRRALDPPRTRVQPLPSPNADRHAPLAGRLSLAPRSALRDLLPDWALYPRYLGGPRRHLAARDERPGARLARRHGRVQTRVELRARVRRTARRGRAWLSAVVVVARRDGRRGGRHERLCRVRASRRW